MDQLTEEEFCKLHTQFYGEELDYLKQLTSQTFTGEELLEFVNFCIKIKNENNTKTKKN
jgi:hypothetical protein